MANKNILWTVDIYEKDPSAQQRVLPYVKELSQRLQAEIQPVFVLSPKTLDISLNRLVELDIDAFVEAAEKNMSAWQSDLKLENLRPGKVLAVNFDSLKACTKAVSEYALSQNSSYIVTSTQGPNVLERFFLGSFAESLITYSKVPVFSVSPEVKVHKPVKKIMIPTLFEPEAQEIYKKYLHLAKAYSAEVLLFNVLPNLHIHVTDGMLFPSPLYGSLDDTIEEEKRRVDGQSQDWISLAESMGVKAECLVSRSQKNIDQLILDTIEEREVGLLAMTSQTGAIEAKLIGSTARKTLRCAKCPVVILHE